MTHTIPKQRHRLWYRRNFGYPQLRRPVHHHHAPYRDCPWCQAVQDGSSRDRHCVTGLHRRAGRASRHRGLTWVAQVGHTRTHGRNFRLCHCQFYGCRASELAGTLTLT